MQPDKPLKVAHRGWHREHIENTLGAFREAYRGGCDMVEFDVQLSRDGVPVIFHDDDCLRLAGRRECVYELDWEELRSLELPGVKTGSKKTAHAAYRIPSLAEFLSEFGARPFYLELKVPEAKSGDAAYFQELGEKSAAMVLATDRDARTFLASFHGGILRHLAKRKSFPLLAGIFEKYSRFQEVYSGADPETAAAIGFYSVSWDIFRKFLKASPETAGALDAQNILIWDINGDKDFRQAEASGVAGIVTDDVETLLALEGRD